MTILATAPAPREPGDDRHHDLAGFRPATRRPGVLPLALPQYGDTIARTVDPVVTYGVEELPGRGPCVVVGRHTDTYAYDLGWLALTADEALAVSSALLTATVWGRQKPHQGPVRPGTPTWLTTLCPEWCAGFHSETDIPGDRTHSTTAGENELPPVPLSVGGLHRTLPGGWVPSVVEVSLWWQHGAPAPYVDLDRDGSPGVHLSVGEAGVLGRALAGLAGSLVVTR